MGGSVFDRTFEGLGPLQPSRILAVAEKKRIVTGGLEDGPEYRVVWTDPLVSLVHDNQSPLRCARRDLFNLVFLASFRRDHRNPSVALLKDFCRALGVVVIFPPVVSHNADPE